MVRERKNGRGADTKRMRAKEWKGVRGSRAVNWNHVGPSRGKQRTALIEATRIIVAHTMKRTSGSRAHTRVAAACARARAEWRGVWMTARASAHVRVRAIDPIPCVDPSERAATSLSFSLFRLGGDIRIPIPLAKAETRGGRIHGYS